MGLILDTDILIRSERRRETQAQMIGEVILRHGNVELAVSAVSAVELAHGIARAKDEATRIRRQSFAERTFRTLPIHPVTLEIAMLAGQIEGQEAARGNVIPIEDLMIGATALFVGFSVCTYNVRDFEKIPGLSVVTL